jgi:glycosyltransferase involved in cell wall biosynthesis
LDDCLWSIRQQTAKNWEAIVVDDGSIDNSRDIIKKYAGLDSRFRPVILPVNRGLSVARNIGIDASKGQFITFLDSDDCMVCNDRDYIELGYKI